MSENCEIFEKKSLLEKTGCGRGAVAPAARNSRKFREFSRNFEGEGPAEHPKPREISRNFAKFRGRGPRRAPQAPRNYQTFREISGKFREIS